MASGYSLTNGGAKLTAEEVATTIVQPLIAQSVVLSAIPAANVLQSNGVPLRIPRIASVDLTDPWRAENTAIAEVDPVIDDVVLLPSSLKSLKTISRVSNELVRHAVAPVGDVFGTALIRKIAATIDAAMLVGPGTADTITGLATLSGTQEITGVGALTADVLHDAVEKLLTEGASPTHWFMHPRDLVGLRKLRDAQGQYIVQADQTEGYAYRLLGIPVLTSAAIPVNKGTGTNESTIMLVDAGQLVAAWDRDMEVAFLDQLFGGHDQLGIRVVSRWDVNTLHREGVVCLRGVKPIVPWVPPTSV